MRPDHAGGSLEKMHTPQAVRRRLRRRRSASYLSDFIYGAIDGAVTTFAVVAGVAGAGLDERVVIILGAANLIADGFSMAVSNFLGSRAERQQREHARREEELHVRLVPEGEREEIRRAIREQRKVRLVYVDQREQSSERTIWPIALAFFERARVVVSWCEMRKDYRAFRTDRVSRWTALAKTYPGSRQQLLRAWREREGIPAPSAG